MNRYKCLLLLSVLAFSAACRGPAPAGAQDTPSTRPTVQATSGTALAQPPEAGLSIAVFAGGCFWCMEGPFEALDGVREVVSGYTDGPEEGPTYSQVARGHTGHTEAVRVVYDPLVVTYDQLLNVFWRSMDPTDFGGQFADRGTQYRPGIYYVDAEQRTLAEASRAALTASAVFDEPIVVPIAPAGDFWIAEDYHQDYYRTNTAHYERYRRGSGREAFLRATWGASTY